MPDDDDDDVSILLRDPGGEDEQVIVYYKVWSSGCVSHSLCVSFSRTDVGLWIYHLFIWSNCCNHTLKEYGGSPRQ